MVRTLGCSVALMLLGCSPGPKPAANSARADPAMRGAGGAPAIGVAPASGAGEAGLILPARSAAPPLIPASRRAFGCADASECRRAGARCEPAILIGKCTCETNADCAPSEICSAKICEFRCQEGVRCARSGRCQPYYDYCIDPQLPSENEFDLREWLAKANAGIPGHDPKVLHATYDEWDATQRHLRVSFRGDGRYVIEVDGISGWNRSIFTGDHVNGRGRELLRTGMLTGVSQEIPSIASLRARSCKEVLSGFRAELVLVAEFASLWTYHGTWTHPKCKGFPTRYVEAIWAFAGKITGGALQPFDREKWGPLPPTSLEAAEPDSPERGDFDLGFQ